MTSPGSFNDERGVSLRDLRAAEDFGRGRPAGEPYEPAAPNGYHRDPAVPADVVARAKAAMRQANESVPPPPAPADPGRQQGAELTAPCPTAAVAPGSADGPPEAPTDRVAPEPGYRERAPEASSEAAAQQSAISDPARLDSPATPRSRASAEAAARAAAEPDALTRQWLGYDPDFVADQLVTLIQARATAGWRSRLGLQPSRAERERRELQTAMCTNFGQPIKVVVANPRGYAGKTTLTVLLAGALGLARGGGVCAFENHELRGVMALRTVANGTQRTTRDFINDLAGMTADQVRHADLTRYVRHQHAGNFDAMVTSRNYGKQLDGGEYRAASALLERFYQVIVIDTANNEAHEAFQAAVADATVLVVPIKWRPTHITPAAQMLNDMAGLSRRHRLLVQNAVVVASNAAGEAVPGARETAGPMFASLAHTVTEIPADPHIEADRPILHHQLRPGTRVALDRLGAAVCAAAADNIREMRTIPPTPEKEEL